MAPLPRRLDDLEVLQRLTSAEVLTMTQTTMTPVHTSECKRSRRVRVLPLVARYQWERVREETMIRIGVIV